MVACPVRDVSMHELKPEGEHNFEEARVALQQCDVVEHGKEVGALSGCLIEEVEVGEAAEMEVPQLCADWLAYCSRARGMHPWMWFRLLGDVLMMRPGCVGRP